MLSETDELILARRLITTKTYYKGQKVIVDNFLLLREQHLGLL